MFNKVKAVFSIPDILRQGKMVSNPEAWKTGQITSSIIAGLLASLVGLGKLFGYDLPVSDDQLLTIGSGVMAVYGVFYHPLATIASSDKIGFKEN